MNTRHERSHSAEGSSIDSPADKSPFEFEDFSAPTLVREGLFAALLRVVRQGPPPKPEMMSSDPQYADSWVLQFPNFRIEVEELCSYIGIEVLPSRTLAELAIEFSKDGFSPKQAESAAKAYLKPKRGAPVSVRQAAVQALELRLADPGVWTWKALGERFCTVEGQGHEHGLGCNERIRQAVMALEAVLRKHRVHPQRTRE